MATPPDTQEGTRQFEKPRGSFGGQTCAHGLKITSEDAHVSTREDPHPPNMHSTLQIPTTPKTLPFETVAMDLIIGLPPNGALDSILTIVDHGCTRAAIFLPCSSTVTGLKVAQLYLNNVYRWFGLPNRMISDRDPRFTSHFARALAAKLGVSQKPIDGLSSPNGRTLGTQEPMDRTISPPSRGRTTRRLVPMASQSRQQSITTEPTTR